MTKIGPLFDFLLHFSIFLLEIFSLSLQLSCETMFKTSNKNIEKFKRKTKKGPILVLSYQDKTKIGPFFDFLLHFSIVYLKFLALLHNSAMFKISKKYWKM